MNVVQYLTSLGKTPDEVAESLRRQGIKGVVRSPCHCPILNGIYAACPDYWSGLLIVNGRKGEGGWSYHATLGDCQICDPQLPQPVMDFIGAFDEGAYPDLVAKRVEVKTVRSWT
jgi:hypothetical protein